MTLLAGDLTTPARFAQWMGSGINPSSIPPVVGQLIGSMTALIYNKLNRARLYSQSFVRTFDGQGTSQLVLPDWPVTQISQVQMGAALINAAPLPSVVNGVVQATSSGFYGYRGVTWAGNLPGDPTVLEFVGGFFWPGFQNIRVTYTAGYLVQNESGTIPAATPFTITVLQQQGIWCRDNGVTFSDGTSLTPVSSNPNAGEYIPPTDTTLGVYTFSSADTGKAVLISYSFIPADLEEACCQMIAERYTYRERVGVESKALGGQETVRFMRGGMRYQMFKDLPPEVDALISPYVSTIPPAIGAPV